MTDPTLFLNKFRYAVFDENIWYHAINQCGRRDEDTTQDAVKVLKYFKSKTTQQIISHKYRKHVFKHILNKSNRCTDAYRIQRLIAKLFKSPYICIFSSELEQEAHD